ncbi:MAG: laccase domain-containing protein [Verrucomicrobia bacterium]|nr:laccase domain-containing protein [Verrucomicrobiota bacterium]
MSLLRFPGLTRRNLPHFFTLREEKFPKNRDLPDWLGKSGLPAAMVSAEQVHGADVARVGRADGGKVVPGADALISGERDVTLVVRAADCGPVWLHCGKTGAIGLVHSGKKGTELGIVPAAIRAMKKELGADPAEMLGLLGPCIRPPHYEVDFAREILRQMKAEGVGEIVDSGLCTASDPERFYSYRREQGKTGRHFAVLARA